MEKVKHVKFYLYKAVTMLDPKFNDRYQLVRQKIDEFGDGEAERAGWTQAKIESLNLWKRHRDQLEEAQRDANLTWKLEEAIVAAIKGKIETVMDDYGDKIEIDKNAFFRKTESEWLLSFQITRLRAEEVPAKKKIGKPRTDIPLDDDEYIGEFTEVLYDTRFDVVTIQSNKYGVGVSKVCRYLNYLYKQYTELSGKKVPKYVIGFLQPVIDEELAQRALKSKRYKSIRYRCSDQNVDAIIPQKGDLIGVATRMVGEQTGFVLDVTLRLKAVDSAQTLSSDGIPDEIREIGENYLAYMNNPSIPDSDKKDAKVELTIVDNDNMTEAVDLLTPKVYFIIPLLIEERKPIGSEYLYDITVDEYKKLVGRLIRVFK